MTKTGATYSMVIDKIFAGPERRLDFPPLSRNCAPMEVRGSDPRVGWTIESQLPELVVRAFTIVGYQWACIGEAESTVREERTEKV